MAKRALSRSEDEHLDLQIRWQNFRGFEDTGWTTLRPLTVLIGPNNSGKTSVLAPLLLLNQTVASRDTMTPLVTKGSLFDAGTFQNVVHSHEADRPVTFGLRYHVHGTRPTPLLKVGHYPPGALEVTLSRSADPNIPVLSKYQTYDLYLRPFLARELQTDGTYSVQGIAVGSLSDDERRAVREARPVNFLFSATRDLYNVQETKDDDGGFAAEFSPQFGLYISIVSYVFTVVRSMLLELSYVGPIRERPRHFYEVSAERPRTVGPTGERAANLLRNRYSELGDRLNFWVQRFEMGDRLEVRDVSDKLFELVFKWRKPRREFNIAEAGFGTSQVLPLIIQALASEPGSLTIAEQPEIHLNPRLQTILAELFVDMAASGRRVVLETHSEHLLLRLRYLIASGRIDPQKVALYYVERTGATSSIREVAVRPDGYIDPTDWPRGFFGDTLRESLALATAQSRLVAG